MVETDPSDVERPLVELGVAGEFGFDEPSIDAARGTCGLDALIGDVEPMIRTFRQPMQTRLQNTWYRTPPDTPEAQVLTKLFSVLEPGDHPITDADIVTELKVNHSEPEGGLPKDLIGWVMQYPEDGDPRDVADTIVEVASAFNSSPKGKRVQVTSFGDACQSLPSKLLKEREVWVKTREPVRVIAVKNSLGRRRSAE